MTEDGRAPVAEQDSVERFGADLRALRLEADSPTLERLRSETGISRTVLSEAFSGRVLPSARTVDRVARACGADPGAWVQRRDALAATRLRSSEASISATVPPTAEPTPTAAPARGEDDPAAAPVSPDPVRTVLTRRAAVGLAAASFLAGVLGATLVLLLLVPGLVSPAGAQPGPRVAVETGADPARTPCVDDATVATGDTRADNSLLEIVWSDACQAGWGRITRYDGLGQGNTVTIAIYPETAPDGPDRQEATEHDVQGAYTTLVVRPTPETLLCAEGSFTVDGTRIDLGEPLCI